MILRRRILYRALLLPIMQKVLAQEFCQLCPPGFERKSNKPLFSTTSDISNCEDLEKYLATVPASDCANTLYSAPWFREHCECEEIETPTPCSLCGDGRMVENAHEVFDSLGGYSCRLYNHLVAGLTDADKCREYMSAASAICCVGGGASDSATIFPTRQPVSLSPTYQPTASAQVKLTNPPTRPPISIPPTYNPTAGLRVTKRPTSPPTRQPISKSPTSNPTSLLRVTMAPANPPTRPPVSKPPSNRPTASLEVTPTREPTRRAPISMMMSPSPTNLNRNMSPTSLSPSRTVTNSPTRQPSTMSSMMAKRPTMTSTPTIEPTDAPTSPPDSSEKPSKAPTLSRDDHHVQIPAPTHHPTRPRQSSPIQQQTQAPTSGPSGEDSPSHGLSETSGVNRIGLAVGVIVALVVASSAGYWIGTRRTGSEMAFRNKAVSDESPPEPSLDPPVRSNTRLATIVEVKFGGEASSFTDSFGFEHDGIVTLAESSVYTSSNEASGDTFDEEDFVCQWTDSRFSERTDDIDNYSAWSTIG